MSELPPNIQQYLSTIAIDSAQMLGTDQVKIGSNMQRSWKVKSLRICPEISQRISRSFSVAIYNFI